MGIELSGPGTIIVKNNIFHTDCQNEITPHPFFIHEPDDTLLDADHNLYYSLDEYAENADFAKDWDCYPDFDLCHCDFLCWQGLGYGLNSQYTLPGFAAYDPYEPSFVNQDFQLAPGSPAVDSGIVIPGVTDGYEGAAPDIGRHEFVNDRVCPM